MTVQCAAAGGRAHAVRRKDMADIGIKNRMRIAKSRLLVLIPLPRV